MCFETSKGENSRIRLFAFCAFTWAFLWLLVLLVLLVRAKSFRKKIIKGLKLPNNLIYITTEFILLQT